MSKRKKQEESLQIAVSNYLNFKYPKTIFTSDASGVRLNWGQSVKLKQMRSDDKIPDMIILEPKGYYHGLILELKNKSPFKKDGFTLKTDAHIQAQDKTLTRLREKNYKAVFVTGLDDAMAVIDKYMSLKIE